MIPARVAFSSVVVYEDRHAHPHRMEKLPGYPYVAFSKDLFHALLSTGFDVRAENVFETFLVIFLEREVSSRRSRTSPTVPYEFGIVDDQVEERDFLGLTIGTSGNG